MNSAVQLGVALEGNYHPLIGIPPSVSYRDRILSDKSEIITLSKYPLEHKVLGGLPGLTKLARQWHLFQSVHSTRKIIQKMGISILHANNSVTMNLPDLIAARVSGIKSICHIRRVHRLSWFDRLTSRYVDYFIAVSEAVKENYVLQGVDPARIQVVYNGVPLERFLPAPINIGLKKELGMDGELPCIGVFTRLTPLKGVDILLQSCAMIIKNGIQIQVLVAGNGPETERLKDLSRALGINNSIYFVGEITDVPAYMLCCDIVVQPSVEADAFPRTVIEAMACGKPVVASHIGGIPESVSHNETGLLFEPGNVMQLTNELSELLIDDNRRQQMGHAAHRIATSKFSHQVFSKNINEAYEAIFNA